MTTITQAIHRLRDGRRALPQVIQGGMGVAVSSWRLASAVARGGQLGVVSGTALDLVLARRLQDGDHRDLHRVDRRQRQMCIRHRADLDDGLERGDRRVVTDDRDGVDATDQ